MAPGGQTATSWVDLINQELSVLHLDRTEILGVGGNIGSHSSNIKLIMRGLFSCIQVVHVVGPMDFDDVLFRPCSRLCTML